MTISEYLIGQPAIFNPNSETWVQYSEGVAYFFQANGVAEERKKAMLLSLMGPTAYKLLRSLIYSSVKTRRQVLCGVGECDGEAPRPHPIRNCLKVQIQQPCQETRRIGFHVLV